MLYVTIAYRYGFTNLHTYLVSIVPAEKDAKSKARQEWLDRGNKYGVEVVRYDETGVKKPETVAYFPSQNGESGPVFGERHYVGQQVGLEVLNMLHQQNQGVAKNPVPDWMERRASYYYREASVLGKASSFMEKPEE